MIHLALENKFCEKKDITEGWKLPTKAYNSVIEWCNVNKIESGREKIESVRGRPKKDKADEPETIKDSSHNKLCTSPIVRLDFHNQGRQSKFQ
jgi:hypothetical protein